jgi:lipoprotein-anchoring transpeptidase ErfK/SrfK
LLFLVSFVLRIEGIVMKRIAPLAGAAMVAVLLPITAAMANPFANRGTISHSTAQANLGGGFIEMLMTGRSPGPRDSGNQRATPHATAHQNLGPPPVYGAAPLSGFAPSYGNSLPMEPPARHRGGTQQQAALNPDFRQVERSIDPKFLPQSVDYPGSHSAGTVVVDTQSRFLYLVEGGGKAMRYGIGVGRAGFEWTGTNTISRKSEWPDWRPPAEMIKRRPDLPRFMAGGPENPMGARGLYLGSTLYRIHGTNEPHTIGQALSSGCIRMRNEDVTDLYDRVRVGTRVIVM